jgi:hypothetical protein
MHLNFKQTVNLVQKACKFLDFRYNNSIFYFYNQSFKAFT